MNTEDNPIIRALTKELNLVSNRKQKLDTLIFASHSTELLECNQKIESLIINQINQSDLSVNLKKLQEKRDKLTKLFNQQSKNLSKWLDELHKKREEEAMLTEKIQEYESYLKAVCR